MPITLTDILGGSELLQKVEQLTAEVDRLKANATRSLQEPKQWLLKSEANKLFIGRGGKPVDRHTFNNMIEKWKQAGYLVDGVNYMKSEDVIFLSKEFLKGMPKYKTANEPKQLTRRA